MLIIPRLHLCLLMELFDASLVTNNLVVLVFGVGGGLSLWEYCKCVLWVTDQVLQTFKNNYLKTELAFQS